MCICRHIGVVCVQNGWLRLRQAHTVVKPKPVGYIFVCLILFFRLPSKPPPTPFSYWERGGEKREIQKKKLREKEIKKSQQEKPATGKKWRQAEEEKSNEPTLYTRDDYRYISDCLTWYFSLLFHRMCSPETELILLKMVINTTIMLEKCTQKRLATSSIIQFWIFNTDPTAIIQLPITTVYQKHLDQRGFV